MIRFSDDKVNGIRIECTDNELIDLGLGIAGEWNQD